MDATALLPSRLQFAFTISFHIIFPSFTIGLAAWRRRIRVLAFMFWGEGLFVFPLMLVYTAISYAVFRGKVRPASVNY